MNSNANAGAESPYKTPQAAAKRPAPPFAHESCENSQHQPKHDPAAEDLLRRYLLDKHSYRLEGNLALRELEGRLASLPGGEGLAPQPFSESASTGAPLKTHGASLIHPSLMPDEHPLDNPDLSHRLRELSAYLHADLTKREEAETADMPSGLRDNIDADPQMEQQPQYKRQKSTPNKPVLDRMWFEERFAALRSSISEISEKQPGPNRRLDLLETQFQKLMERMEAREAADRSHSTVQAGLNELAAYLEDSKQWNITQNARLRSVEDKIDRLSNLVARSHEAISATAKGLELVAQGTGRRLAEETAALVSYKMDAKFETLNAAQPFDELSREVASLSMQTRQSARSTDEKIKSLQGRLESSLKRLGFMSGEETSGTGSAHHSAPPSSMDLDDSGDYEHKLFAAAQRAARLADEHDDVLSPTGEPIRYQIPYGEFLPDEERSHSHIGLIVAAVILLLASGAMLYLNLSDRKASPRTPQTETSENSVSHGRTLKPVVLPPVTTASTSRTAKSLSAYEMETPPKRGDSGRSWTTETTTATLSRALSAAKPMEDINQPVAQIAMIGLNEKSENLRKAAVQGNLGAQFSIGQTYLHGDDLAANLPAQERLFAAARWFRRAAEKGHAPSQYRLATLYELGQGLSKDIDEAQIWYERAAKQGHVKAMHNLAVLAVRGNERSRDYLTAVKWFTLAAEQGLPESQYNLALLYERGLGVKHDLQQAYQWASLAALSGDEKAAQKRDRLAQSLSAEERSRVERRNLDWRKAPVDGTVNAKGIDLPERAATSDGPEAKKSAPPISTSWSTQVTSEDVLIAKAQRLLQTLGYKPGPVDGIFGPRTSAAIREFEAKAGLEPTGDVTENLLAKLASAKG